MSVFRIHKNKDYTTMSNRHLRDTDISWQAKGMLSFMLSNSDTFDYSIQGLTKCATNGESSVRSILKELKESGYLQTHPVTNERGQITDWAYDIFEVPHDEYPAAENPVVENPHVENQPQRNTNTNNLRSIHSSPTINSSPTTSTTQKQKEIKTNLIKESKEKVVDLSFVSIHYQDTFKRFLDYRVEIKKPLKEVSWKAAYEKLYQLSKGDPSTAQKIVDQTIANGWQGLFELKENRNGNNNGNSGDWIEEYQRAFRAAAGIRE